MVERAAFLNAVHSAWHHRGMPREDAEMTRVGLDTPRGEYLRRHWQPIVLAGETLARDMRRSVAGVRSISP